MFRNVYFIRSWRRAASLGLLAISHTACYSGRTLLTGRGPEDLALVTIDGQSAIVTATAFRTGRPCVPGSRLELYRPGPGSSFRPVYVAPPGWAGQPADFVPLALYAVDSSRAAGRHGRQLVYVLNTRRPKTERNVLVFEVGAEAFLPVDTLPLTNLLPQANGLAVSRDGVVYVSNFRMLDSFHHHPRAVRGQYEGKLANTVVAFLPDAHPTPHHKGRWQVVAAGSNGANGLALTPDDRFLLVNAYHARRIDAFTRNADGTLAATVTPVLRKSELKGCHPDNLKPVPRTNTLVVAGQRNRFWTGLRFLLPFIPVRGRAYEFAWNGSATHLIRHNLRGDTKSPSTVLPLGDSLYIGHIVWPGVVVIKR